MKSSGMDEEGLVELSQIERHHDDESQYFIHLNNEQIVLTDGNYLHQLFEDKYSCKFRDYDAFLSFLLNKPHSVDMDDSVSHYQYYYFSFCEDKEVSLMYKRNGLEFLQKRYCYRENDEIIIKPVSINKKLTIAYCHWLNGYVYRFGGITGYEYLYKSK